MKKDTSVTVKLNEKFVPSDSPIEIIKLEFTAPVTGERKQKNMKRKYKVGDIFEGTFGKVEVVEDFLPPPSELVFKQAPETVKVTLTLEKSSVTFFKQQANKLGGSYQRMMRNLLSQYANRHQVSSSKTI
jgi:predicted DNA binding CopG/RHH family protein